LLHCTIRPIVATSNKEHNVKNLIYTQYRPVARYIHENRLEHTVALAERIAGLIADTWRTLQTLPDPPAVIIDGRAMTPDADHFMRFAPR